MEEIEIPEAIRESIELPRKSRLMSSMPAIAGAIFCISIVGLIGLWFFSASSKSTRQADISPPAKSVKPTKDLDRQPPLVKPAPAIQAAKPTPQPKSDLLGHLPYDVAPESELKAIPGTNLRMRAAAARKFEQMQSAASAEGIVLTSISAFRDDETQEELFFGVKEQRAQDATKRAEVSAPPGYSEHHTGYAIDIGDGNAPATNLSETFGDTAAFRWLEQNALKYSFELSFPPDNKQGVSYEPWHWRFVGDRDSLETFYKVRN